jgi:hypothetical protein
MGTSMSPTWDRMTPEERRRFEARTDRAFAYADRGLADILEINEKDKAAAAEKAREDLETRYPHMKEGRR